MIAGLAAVAAGYFWGLTFPVNKNLWTSSYVLVTSGLASLWLGAMYYIVDVRKYTTGTTLGIIFGSNAIAIYFLSDVISYLFYLVPFGSAALNEHFMTTLTGMGLAPKLVSLFYAMIFVCINFGIAYVLYKKKIFIKL